MRSGSEGTFLGFNEGISAEQLDALRSNFDAEEAAQRAKAESLASTAREMLRPDVLVVAKAWSEGYTLSVGGDAPYGDNGWTVDNIQELGVLLAHQAHLRPV